MSVPSSASFSEAVGIAQVCVSLMGLSAVPIDVTVAATDGKLGC